MARRRKPRRYRRSKASALNVLVGAGVVGAAVGAGSIATTSEGRAALIVTAKHVADAAVGKRKREPREGDYWSRCDDARAARSEEHTSELQSLMRNSYAVFCLEKKK